VIEIAGNVPVLVRGGGRAADEEILKRTEELMKQGAAGSFMEEILIQHPKPAAMNEGANEHCSTKMQKHPMLSEC